MKKIAFIGAGNMARAIIVGLISSGVAAKNIMVANPSPEKRVQLANEFGVQHTSDNIEAATFADIIVLSVKPHFICDVCEQLSGALDISNKLFISVAAGTTVAQIQQALHCNAALVRVMPNTPSQLGLGMSGMFASKEVSQEQKAASDKLMSAVGNGKTRANAGF